MKFVKEEIITLFGPPQYIFRDNDLKFDCKVGDRVLLRRDKQPEGSKFEARTLLGPFNVISVEHPRYVLENAPGRKSRKPVHFRRLRRYQERDDNIPMVKRSARIAFVSHMNNRLIRKRVLV